MSLNSLPLLEGCLPGELPEDVCNWVDPTHPLPRSVRYHRSYIPSHPAFFVGGAMFLGIVPVIQLISLVTASEITVGRIILVGSLTLPFLIGIGFLLRRASQSRALRHDHAEGRIRAGLFVNQDVFLDFDGNRAWLFPREVIDEVLFRPAHSRGGSEHRMWYLPAVGPAKLHGLAASGNAVKALRRWHKTGRLPAGSEWERGTEW